MMAIFIKGDDDSIDMDEVQSFLDKKTHIIHP